jgi:ribosomal 50S subunit-associated protein YjgA (DUF615 family)
LSDQTELPRTFWIELLGLYDEFMQKNKTDEKTISMLDKAGLLLEGTKIGEELLANFPHLDYKDLEGLVRVGVREKITECLRKAPDDTI